MQSSLQPMMKQRAGMPFFRITLLGGGGSGKTCLANTWVNNCCPARYVPTEKATLYYKVAKLYSDDDDDVITNLVEIEDTPSSEKGFTKDNKVKGGEPASMDPQAALPINRFLDLGVMSAQQRMAASQKDKKGHKDHRPTRPNKEQMFAMRHPFLACDRPKRLYEEKRLGHEQGLTKNRMGYFIVFDSNSEWSLKEAQKIYRMLVNSLEVKKQADRRPPIWLIAAKIDKNPASVHFHYVMESANIWSQQVSVPLWMTSAHEYESIRKLFKEMLITIRGNQMLYAIDAMGEDEEEEEVKKCVVS